jgi:gas vesicle protein
MQAQMLAAVLIIMVVLSGLVIQRWFLSQLRFYVFLMAGLTLVVSGFTVMLWREHSGKVMRVQMDLNRLKKMKETAETDQELREWVIHERKSQSQTHKIERLADFLLELANRRRIQIKSFQPQPQRDRGSFYEKSFQIVISQIDSKSLTQFMFDCQNEWPGLSVKNLQASRVKNRVGVWKATITVSVFATKSS